MTEPRPVGRPSLFTGELAEEICDRLIEGESLRQICNDDHMPNRRTVLRWLDDDADFAAKYARARTLQADYMDDLILETARNCDAGSATADRVRIDAYKWRASKLQPKRYSDKVGLEGAGADGAIVVQINKQLYADDPAS